MDDINIVDAIISLGFGIVLAVVVTWYNNKKGPKK